MIPKLSSHPTVHTYVTSDFGPQENEGEPGNIFYLGCDVLNAHYYLDFPAFICVHFVFPCHGFFLPNTSSCMFLLYQCQRRHKKAPATRVVALHDTDEEHDSLIDTGSGGTGSSVPLRYEKRIQKIKDLSKQMPDS